MTASDREDAAHAGWVYAGDLLGEGIGLVFTDRYGGESPPPYDTLNLAYHTGDDPDIVRRNRISVARVIDIPESRIFYLEQVHGLEVVQAGSRGAVARKAFAAADGIYTIEPGAVLAVLTADCVPIALHIPAMRAVAMLHAGWKGTIGNIVAAAMHGMKEELGSDIAGTRAVLGPAIHPCCYGVDEGRAHLFVERYGEESMVMTGEAGRNLDLVRANVLNLIEAGVKEENISMVGGCTCCEHRYFSYRRDGDTGRQGAFIFMRE